MSDWRQELLAAALLGAAFLAWLLAAELWLRLGRPKPEWTRKLVHLGGGLTCLFFPFLIRSPWTVFAMAAAMSALFALGRRTQLLPSLFGVTRRSWGSEYYPLAVALVFLLAYGRPWLYLSSILTLAVADAFAALVGEKYGTIHYQVEEGKKSLEGSLVFLLITFLTLLLPTLLMTDIPRPVCVLSALLVAVLVTGFEAISLHGSDNLFVPVVVCVALDKITTKPLSEVVYLNLSLAGLCLGIGLVAWRVRAINIGGKIAFLLFAYGAWSLGSRLWALPIFLGFLVYLLIEQLFPPLPGDVDRVRVRRLTRALMPPVTLLLLANAFSRYDLFYGPYLAACSAVLAFGLAIQLRYAWPSSGWRHWAWTLGVACFAWLTVALLPWWLLAEPAGNLLAVAGASTLAVLAEGLRPRPGSAELADPPWSAGKFLLSFAAAAAVFVLQWAALVSPWRAG